MITASTQSLKRGPQTSWVHSHPITTVTPDPHGCLVWLSLSLKGRKEREGSSHLQPRQDSLSVSECHLRYRYKLRPAAQVGACWRCCASWILDARYNRGVNYGTYYSSNEVLRLRRPDHHSYCFNFTSSFSHHWLFTVLIPKYIMSYYYFMYISLDVLVYSQRHLIITSKGYASTPMTGNKWVSTYWVSHWACESTI